jgi:nicotinate-nucleotide pyrophosphorylase (carboxylating)
MYAAMIRQFVLEDAPEGDITTKAIVGDEILNYRGDFIAKQDLVLSGIFLIKEIIKQEFPRLKLRVNKEDGSSVKKGCFLAMLSGPVQDILVAERLCLNLLQRLSGIATFTKSVVYKAKPYGVNILDTRKTIPGYRREEKQAVKHGGADNHRMSLSDQYLIKDNHIEVKGSVRAAVESVRTHQKKTKQKSLVEVEVKTKEQFLEVLPMLPDIILLDNMTPELITELVHKRNEDYPDKNNRPLLEISGGVTLDNLEQFLTLRVDRISMGALTHSAAAADIALNIRP